MSMKRIAATVHPLRRAACARAVVPLVLAGLLAALILGLAAPRASTVTSSHALRRAPTCSRSLLLVNADGTTYPGSVTLHGVVTSSASGAPGHLVAGAAHYAGWAMDAYPGDSVASLGVQMQRQVNAGANIVWLGHNNPGEVSIDKGEPALSFAVWAAYRDPAAARHSDAVAMVHAQRQALDAARAVGVQVILPVGYQT
jgi:hypothetical protein